MARLFFHLHECGMVTRDEEGQEVVDLVAARAKAVQSARAIMCGEVTEGRLCLACHITVTNLAGDCVLTIPFREAVEVSGL